ncbi:MAG TPA: LysM peptidoglycan-binding domain-containing protein [Chloroflexi bacterium]|nr:LysM peptidoglycan-binding domain-containing protein [Chloroflexota bacterium]
MDRRFLVLLVGGLLLLSLAGCTRGTYEETPVAAEASPTSVPTASALEAAQPTSPPPASPSSLDQSPSVYLEPSVVNMTVGQTAVVKVWIEGAHQLNHLVLTMLFDPDYVQVEDADAAQEGVQIAPGTIPAPLHVIQNQVTVESEKGRIVYEVAQDSGEGASGNGVVAVITLRGVAAGGTPLEFESVAAYDAAGNPIEITPLSDGLITVLTAAEGEQAVGPQASPQPTAPSPPAPSPQPTPSPPAPTPSAAPTADTGIYYVVQSGENLFRIGLKFGTTAEAIAQASNLPDPGEVKAGTMVLIPVPPPQGRYGYYVQPHDTVYSIARRFGLTVDQLVALNDIGPDYRIEVGQILTVVP